MNLGAGQPASLPYGVESQWWYSYQYPYHSMQFSSPLQQSDLLFSSACYHPPPPGNYPPPLHQTQPNHYPPPQLSYDTPPPHHFTLPNPYPPPTPNPYSAYAYHPHQPLTQPHFIPTNQFVHPHITHEPPPPIADLMHVEPDPPLPRLDEFMESMSRLLDDCISKCFKGMRVSEDSSPSLRDNVPVPTQMPKSQSSEPRNCSPLWQQPNTKPSPRLGDIQSLLFSTSRIEQAFGEAISATGRVKKRRYWKRNMILMRNKSLFQSSDVPSLLGNSVSAQSSINTASDCPVSGIGYSVPNLNFVNHGCGRTVIVPGAKLSGVNVISDYEKRSSGMNVEMDSGNGKDEMQGPYSCDHALNLLGTLSRSDGFCNVGGSIQDKGGGLAYFQPLEDVIGVNYAKENEGIDKSVGKADQLEDGNAILKMEISTQLIKREDMLKVAPMKKDPADEIVLASHNHVNESMIKYKDSWDRNTLEKIDDACLKQEEGNALVFLYPRCGKAELEDEVYCMYRYDDSVSLLEHDIKPGPLDQSGLNFGSGNTCESEALRVKRMMFQVTKMLFNQAPDDKDGYDIHDDDHKCHLHSIFMEPLLAFYLRYIHRHPILGRSEFLAKVSYTVLNVEKYIFGTVVNICTALVIEYGPSGIVEVSEKWSLDAMNMKMEAIIRIIGCTVELELPVNFLEKHMQRGEKCWSCHYDQGLISSCIQFNHFLVYGNVECIVFCCSTLLQWMKLQLYVEVVQNGINHMMHTSLRFQAVVDLPVCTIIEFGIVATLNVWYSSVPTFQYQIGENKFAFRC